MNLPDPIPQLLEQEQLHEAARHCKEILDEQGESGGILITLGLIHARHKDWRGAHACFRRALSCAPESPEAWFNLGRVQLVLKQHEEALGAFLEALRLRPGFPEVCLNAGRIRYQQRRWREAQVFFEQALKGDPEVTNPLCYLRRPALDNERVERDVRHFRAVVHNELGKSLRNQGEPEQALNHFLRALRLKPDFVEAHSHLLFILSYNVMCAPGELLRAHRDWDEMHGRPGRENMYSHGRDENPARRLRIAYLSPAFCFHVISFFMEPILRAHDREQVEVFCYAEVNQPDDYTEHLKTLADAWRSTVGMSDEALARQIHEDRIDVVVDLAGHTNYSRLRALTYKPAPVQATYLGYFSTTGLRAMDYWLTDAVLHPDDTVELAAERFYRLPRCCVCYRPPDPSPPVRTTPRGEEGIVFGSFNDLLKTTPRAIALWCRVLHAVPGSRMLLKTGALADPGVMESVRERFAAHGIPPERLILRPPIQSHFEHLASYGDMDIALDTVPRTGGTTTADALWMGVPVITLAGNLFIERLSSTMLHAVGAQELIASTEEAYVAKAVALARDAGRRQWWRQTLRKNMAASPLCDGAGLARALEAAYRDMWRRYLDQEA